MKNITMKILNTLIAIFMISSCAHHRDVRPGAEQVHKVVIKTDDKVEGSRNAISQAQHYCKGHKKEAAFVTDEARYEGDMNESDYNTAKRVSTAVQTVGNAAWVLGDGSTSNAGGLLGLGGMAANGILGEAYTVEMKFKCL